MTTPKDRAGLVKVMSGGVFAVSYDTANAILTAIEAAGCRVVPVEMTLEMVTEKGHDLGCDGCREEWTTMLNASPYRPDK